MSARSLDFAAFTARAHRSAAPEPAEEPLVPRGQNVPEHVLSCRTPVGSFHGTPVGPPGETWALPVPGETLQFATGAP